MNNSICKCGKEILGYKTKCYDCVEIGLFNDAIKISIKDYEGDFLYDQTLDEFFKDIDDLEDHYERENLDMPNYVYACNPIKFSLDIENIVENELVDNHYEDAYEDVIDIEELISFIDKWTDKQKIVSYERSFTTVILLD